VTERRIRLLCVDDNQWVAEAIERRLRREPDFQWLGWLPHAGELLEKAEALRPDVVLLDVDIPGDDTFDATERLVKARPEARVVMLSGHVKPDYVDRAIAAGAWGYICKSEENDAIIGALRRVVGGEFVLLPETLIDSSR
jgi:two-component system, NarL family, nitrate/nitrite response regulator NarL